MVKFWIGCSINFGPFFFIVRITIIPIFNIFFIGIYSLFAPISGCEECLIDPLSPCKIAKITQVQIIERYCKNPFGYILFILSVICSISSFHSQPTLQSCFDQHRQSNFAVPMTVGLHPKVLAILTCIQLFGGLNTFGYPFCLICRVIRNNCMT